MPKTTTTVGTSSKQPYAIPAISYRLSEPFFLDIGWTVPPLLLQNEHRLVTMKAKFSHPIICPWFKERSEDAIGKYSNGCILYLAKKNGTGKIYYPNGKVAIKIEKGGPRLMRTKVWVYHSGDVERNGTTRPPEFCALFDCLGNGIVYDSPLKKRLVYNQREGLMYGRDESICMRWKWHNIQESDISLTEEEEEEEEETFKGPCDDHERHSSADNLSKSILLQSTTSNRDKRSSKIPDSTLPDPTSEAEVKHANYFDTGKMKPRKVTPLKPIFLELNKNVSLRILDQSNVSLSFFAEGRHAKLNIGVLYNPFEKFNVTQIDVEPKENEIICPYEHSVANTRSLLKFRKLMEKLKRKFECQIHDY